MENEEIKVLFDNLQNAMLNRFIDSFMPDDDMKATTMKLIRCCNKHGVKTETLLEIAKDLMD